MACVCSSDPTLRAMWPDGQQDITEVTKRPLTAGTLFKNSMVALVENLACKVLPPPPPCIFPGPSICAWPANWAPTASAHHREGGVHFLSAVSCTPTRNPTPARKNPPQCRLRCPGLG